MRCRHIANVLNSPAFKQFSTVRAHASHGRAGGRVWAWLPGPQLGALGLSSAQVMQELWAKMQAEGFERTWQEFIKNLDVEGRAVNARTR